MPHCKDGQEAKVGDLVKGVSYNKGGKTIVGEVIQITPGSMSCNCVVAFVETKPLPAMPEEIKRTHVIFRRHAGGLVSSEPQSEILDVSTETDYGQLDSFELVYRPA